MSILERWLPYRELKKTTKELQRQLVWGWRPSYRNVLFKQQVTYIRCLQVQSWTKVLGTVLQYSYLFVILFEIISQFSLPHPIQSWNSEKFWIHASSIVCGVRGGVGHVWIGKSDPRNAKVSQDFCTWLQPLRHLKEDHKFSPYR